VSRILSAACGLTRTLNFLVKVWDDGQEAVRVALLMRFPCLIRPGRATAALVELIDLAPTILELCGVPVPANLHGRSLTSLLQDQTGTHREYVIAEYADNEEAMIRTERWKLIYSTGPRTAAAS
jgi:arylsulfatase A-like enzyme